MPEHKFLRVDEPCICDMPEKGNPADADYVVLEDSADGNAKKRAQVGNLPASVGFDPDRLIITTEGGLVYDNDGVIVVKAA